MTFFFGRLFRPPLPVPLQALSPPKAAGVRLRLHLLAKGAR